MRKTSTTISQPYCMVTIRRPNGQIETLRHPHVSHMLPATWAEMQRQMRDAGRGECLSYVNDEGLTEVPMALEQQRAELCSQLSAALDQYQRASLRGMARSQGWGDSADVATIEAELAEFDREHPQVVANITAQRAATAAHAIDKGY